MVKMAMVTLVSVAMLRMAFSREVRPKVFLKDSGLVMVVGIAMAALMKADCGVRRIWSQAEC